MALHCEASVDDHSSMGAGDRRGNTSAEFIGPRKGGVETRIYSSRAEQHPTRAEAVKEHIFFSCSQGLGGGGGRVEVGDVRSETVVSL